MHDDAIIAAFDFLILFIVANNHAAIPEMVRERVGHLLIEKGQQAIAGVDQIHFHIHTAEDGRIFAADNAGAVNNNVARFMVETQD
ncbi:hypothetical protein SEENIN0B_04387 [Salmonella enterica subsp. enterica serovar Infantis str. SARB27]|uniref:Uncharacterized protein n=3 Tax=Salmonella enterica I TaxID=59201 RepID=M7RK46_SALDU|nr:hypothetical protein SEENIN0B_04387 [Salmonella enterica subsp. enterica serovar Infantis str. SARB27]EMR52052.1 hypothetical protein A670_02804 [Salmonella enterica subsp. enterica serovar Dublin str. UC16]EPI69907.1 hypothetical protein A671_02479 [Salmonella enterica subsp. enterica serovar Dublin str. DG22]EPI74423.1 hypothetical protein A673_01155 [Salmonella enterica subsp. enterica serovar Enteritidis str. 2009K0958]EPI76947.1 hypothetical protein A672_00767 [Salmonella enterica subsp